ncbi:hypothetical protein [Aeromonas sp. Y318-3]|uniref:hypothetical protein n=1 Tax=Aeromonas sp. Y318-3 TaxID=2990509 RepID=UPI0022E1E609|nr:hypothetical protein [Aeromonas sp. Y318-3]
MSAFKFKPATDLELYELLVAAYPDKFSEDGPDIWDDVMEFAEELVSSGEVEVLSELLGRIVMLASPMQGMIAGESRHSLGKVTIQGNQVLMTSAISRPVAMPEKVQ